MEFSKCIRNEVLFLSEEWLQWRLASVDEVTMNMKTIKEKGILESWDIAVLLDGWVDGPGYRYHTGKFYKGPLGHILLVRTAVSRSFDGSFAKELYGGVELSNEGREAALLFSCEAKFTEVICFVLQSIVDSFKTPGERQVELDRLTESLMKTFKDRKTVVHYAADQPFNGEHAMFVAKFVLNNFEYGRELIKYADKYGRTALHFAALNGHLDLCTFLVKVCGLKADEKDRSGENLLHCAVNSNKVDIVRSLMQMKEVKMLVDSQDSKGKTPLHKAAANGNKDIIDILLKHGVQVEEYIRRSDLFGQTALLEAVSQGHQEAVKYLLEKGSRPLFERNSDGKTALHCSVLTADNEAAIEIAELLLDNCRSEEERLRLLCVSATGMGTAEQSAESSPELQTRLKEHRERIAGTSIDLFATAVKLGFKTLASEIISQGGDTNQIKNFLEKLPEGGRDQPTIHDSLGRRAFAEGLAALFLNPYVKSPVTVGISGEWGMGKSSLMLQTEMILLQARAQLAFPNILPFQDFPESTLFELTRKGRKKYNKMKHGMKTLLRDSQEATIDDPLVYFLEKYQDKYPQVYKSLALMDRGEIFRLNGKQSDSSSNLGKIPTILTVRYNAWHYQNDIEAWAGLAVTITKAMEETMTKSQRIRSCWRYTWKERGGEIGFEFLLPCLLALFLSGWLTWAFWMLLGRSKKSELQDLRYGSIPITLVVVFWTIMKQLHSVFKPVSVRVLGYLRLRDHSTNLGYQHQVISDINFLKKEIQDKPSLFWKFLAGNWLWRMCGRYLDTVEGTSIPKTPPPSQDEPRIIVFVDDLDRCEEAVILQVLSAVNLVLAVCEINVIIGMDKKMIARAIAHQYQQQYQGSNNLNMVDAVDLAEKYLSKIVQLPLALPDSSNDERIQFLNQQLGEEFKQSGDNAANAQLENTESIRQRGSEPSPDFITGNRDNSPQSFNEERLPLISKLCNCFIALSCWLSRFSSDVETGNRENPPESFLANWPIISKLIHRLIIFIPWIFGCSSGHHRGSSKLKSTLINSQLILPSYSDQEREAITFLSTQATHGPQIPRDWKRFLTYHRLAWNILFRLKKVNHLPGWQVQLIVWIFCCWQWKHYMNLIVKDWKELTQSLKSGTVNDEDPSLKIIVEHCVDKYVEDNAEKDKWQLIIQTLIKYDVSMESIQSFQKFRLHCEIGYLPPPAADAPESLTSVDSV